MKKRLRNIVLLLAVSFMICGCSQPKKMPAEQNTQQSDENGLGIWEIEE